ncbi:MAG: hypothetical protein KF713_03325 [Turneriella sp.]|nr:hypothetical protein [Turneriella sp.]
MRISSFKGTLAAVIAAFFLVGYPPLLRAEKLNAAPLSGPGDYEFLFFSADKKPEIDGLTARFRELDPELQNLHNDLKKTEEQLAAFSAKSPGKRTQRLDWSPIDGATGYSVKLFDAKKNLIDTRSTEENSLAVELDQGEYYFQVAAATKFKTGTYSRMTSFRVTRGKPSAEQVAATERAENLREKIRIQRSIRGEYLKTLRSLAAGDASAGTAEADLTVPDSAAFYLAVNKKSEPYAMSQITVLPGRNLKISETATTAERSTASGSNFFWGAGLVAGIQDSSTSINAQSANDFFRTSLGVEGFLRYNQPFLRFFYPQVKLQAAYSAGKTNVFDAMLYANLYPGVYYPITLGKGFTLFVSLSTGANVFILLSSAASGSVLQWGVMPGVEMQYSLNEKLAIYMGGAINFTYDTSGTILKFIPINLGVTRRF